MPKIGGACFDTPAMRLFVPAPGAQKPAIAAPHQGEAVVYQTDDEATGIVGLPGLLWDAFLSKQCQRDHTIAATGMTCVERTRDLP